MISHARFSDSPFTYLNMAYILFYFAFSICISCSYALMFSFR